MTMSSLLVVNPEVYERRAARPTGAGIADLLAPLRDGDVEATLAACEAALASNPNSASALFGIAVVAVLQGELSTAAALLSRAHDLDPDEAIYAEVLATVYALAGDVANATYFAKLSQALGLDEQTLDPLPAAFPRFANAYLVISERPLHAHARHHAARGEFDLAANRLRQQLAFDPHHAPAQRDLAALALALGRPWEAADVLALMQKAGNATPADTSLLARAHAAMGDTAIAEVQHLQAAATAPDDPEIAARRVVDMPLVPGATVKSLRDAGADWERRFARAADPADAPTPSQGKRRIGFLCSALADARDQEMLAEVALGLTKDRYEFFAYGFGDVDSPGNKALRPSFNNWRNCAELDADTLAFSIRGDGVEVLFDLGGFHSPMQLMALAQRPAPVQVSWLGSAAPLALGFFDAILADDATDAAEIDGKGFAKRLYRLPHGLRAYRLPHGNGPSAARDGGAVCIGADVSLAQLHPDLCETWAQILKAAPQACLLLRNRGYDEEPMVRRLVERFVPHGVGSQVDVHFGDAADYYASLDFALAPFVAQHPHEEAAMLAHGVPVVALAGQGRHRRQASGLLTHAGLSRLVAKGAEDYVKRALDLAGSADACAKAAAEVAHAATSPVFKPPALAAEFERAITELCGDRS
jgi:protein O-GlcNAc transferase